MVVIVLIVYNALNALLTLFFSSFFLQVWFPFLSKDLRILARRL